MNPLAGDWRVDRTMRTVTAGCPDLALTPLDLTLRPGSAQQIDLGAKQASVGDNMIAGNHIIFASSELGYPGASGPLVIQHDLEIQNTEDYLMGTAVAEGGGAQAGCRWEMDAMANRASR